MKKFLNILHVIALMIILAICLPIPMFSALFKWLERIYGNVFNIYVDKLDDLGVFK
jgi:hypothetical protein